MTAIHFSWPKILELCYVLKARAGMDISRKVKVYGVPRGGSVVAALIGLPVDTPEEAKLIVDDIIDSGTTLHRYRARFPNKPFYALLDKRDWPEIQRKDWIVFPWELADASGIEENVNRLIQYCRNSKEQRREVMKAMLNVVDTIIKEDL